MRYFDWITVQEWMTERAKKWIFNTISFHTLSIDIIKWCVHTDNCWHKWLFRLIFNSFFFAFQIVKFIIPFRFFYAKIAAKNFFFHFTHLTTHRYREPTLGMVLRYHTINEYFPIILSTNVHLHENM